MSDQTLTGLEQVRDKLRANCRRIADWKDPEWERCFTLYSNGKTTYLLLTWYANHQDHFELYRAATDENSIEATLAAIQGAPFVCRDCGTKFYDGSHLGPSDLCVCAKCFVPA